MNFPSRALALLSLLSLAACETVSVDADYDRRMNFASYKTFAWAPAPDTKSLPGPTAQAAITAAAERELTAKGLRKTSPERADFEIVYYIRTEQRTDLRNFSGWDFDTPYRPGFGYYRDLAAPPLSYTEVDQYRVSELTLDFVDTHSQRLVWRAIGSMLAGAPADEARHTDEAVTAMLAKFPPKQ